MYWKWIQWWCKNLLFKGQMSWLAKINRTFVLVTKTAHQTFTHWGFWEILFYVQYTNYISNFIRKLSYLFCFGLYCKDQWNYKIFEAKRCETFLWDLVCHTRQNSQCVIMMDRQPKTTQEITTIKCKFSRFTFFNSYICEPLVTMRHSFIHSLTHSLKMC